MIGDLDPADPYRAELIAAWNAYHAAVTLAYRTRIANECYGSAMSPVDVAALIPDETIDMLILHRKER